MKEADYQQRIRQLEIALKESREREASLQRRLEEAVSEVECTKAQVADLQIVMKKGREEVKKSKEREASLQRRLEEAVSEVECTKAQVADLQIVVERGHQEVTETKLQYEVNRKVLISANHTIRKDLKAVCNQLDIATRDFTGAGKWRCAIAYMGVLCAVYEPACGPS